jgi:hypothetical protein
MRILRDCMAFTNFFAVMTNFFVRDRLPARNDNAARSETPANRAADSAIAVPPQTTPNYLPGHCLRLRAATRAGSWRLPERRFCEGRRGSGTGRAYLTITFSAPCSAGRKTGEPMAKVTATIR